MKRFDDIDLSQLPPPAFPETVSFEALRAARLADLAQRLEAAGVAYDVNGLESDPSVIHQEADAYRETLVRQRLNDAVRAVLVSSATGADLDHAVADFGLVRLEISPANPATGAPAVMESDESLRRRRLAAVEALSSAGPEGAYVFQAATAHPHVGDVAVYGPEAEIPDPDGGPGATITGPGKVVVVILSNQANPVPTGQVVAAVAARLQHEDIRPLTDHVVVLPAKVVEYAISGVLTVPDGPDASVLVAAAEERLQALTGALKAIGAGIPLRFLEAAATVFGENGAPLVLNVDLSSPAADLEADALTAYVCTGITLTAEVAA